MKKILKDLLWINIESQGIAAIYGFDVPYGDITYIKDTMEEMGKLGVSNET